LTCRFRLRRAPSAAAEWQRVRRLSGAKARPDHPPVSSETPPISPSQTLSLEAPSPAGNRPVDSELASTPLGGGRGGGGGLVSYDLDAAGAGRRLGGGAGGTELLLF
jgi:hypothetical protein